MATPSRTYTPEWFEVMLDRNPEQVDTARLAAKHAGTEQCCMVPGDTRDVADFMTDETVSVRICGDCKTIQEGMYGGLFLPME